MPYDTTEGHVGGCRMTPQRGMRVLVTLHSAHACKQGFFIAHKTAQRHQGACGFFGSGSYLLYEITEGQVGRVESSGSLLLLQPHALKVDPFVGRLLVQLC